MTRFDAMGIILIFSFFAILGYVMFDFISPPSIKIVSIFPPFLLFIFIWLNSGVVGEFLGFLHNPNFITRGGAIGVLKSFDPLESGLAIAKVYLYKRYVPNKKLISKEMGISGFMSWFSATTTIEVIDTIDRFKSVPMEYLDAREGAMLYDGTLKGVDVPTEYQTLKMENRILSDIISQSSTKLEKAMSIAAAASTEQNRDILETSKKISTALFDVFRVLDKTSQKENPPIQREK